MVWFLNVALVLDPHNKGMVEAKAFYKLDIKNIRRASMVKRDGYFTAILVDGGFYRKRAKSVFGDKSPQERAEELDNYCRRHLTERNGKHELYRIFYYDCMPLDKVIHHPLTNQDKDFSKTDLYTWSIDFFNELKKRRKFALRMGKLAAEQAAFSLKTSTLRNLCKGKIKFTDLEERDFIINVDQKGVDMKIGLDIASLAYKKQVDQIVLISGDSDFVSAAKLARREGIDFILDPLGSKIKPDLFEHIDGLRSCDKAYDNSKNS